MKNLISTLIILGALYGLTATYNYITNTSVQRQAQYLLEAEALRCSMDQAQNPNIVCD